MRHFAAELEELKQALLEMAALVESSIHTSVQSLTEKDDRLARRVIEDEGLINKMELDLDARVTRLLALNQPVAGDLRLLVMCLKINTDLERMGDLAVSVAERAISLNKLNAPLGAPLAEMPRMASIVEDMLHRTLDSFVKGDAEAAQSILRTDDEVDALRDVVYRSVISIMRTQPDLVDAAVHLMFVARSLERIADHATNIAEDIIYMVRGVDVRHHAAEEL